MRPINKEMSTVCEVSREISDLSLSLFEHNDIASVLQQSPCTLGSVPRNLLLRGVDEE